MKKILKYFLLVALAALVVIQFIRPDKNQQGYETVAVFEAETKPSAEIKTLLKNNCYDCHSNQTNYPWYAEIAPVSFWLEEHIEHGKDHFNVSEWSNYSAKKKDHKLEEFIEYVEERWMPLSSYTLIHGDLSDNEIKMLTQWAAMVRLQYQNEIQNLSK